MNWIKWVKGLSKRREVLLIAAELDLDNRHVAGLLMELWEWADDNVDFCPDFVRDPSAERPSDVQKASETCHVPGVKSSFVDRLVGVTGLAQAMLHVGWLREDEQGISFPNAERHNGRTAKKRAIDAERKRIEREKSASEKRPQSVRETSARTCDQRREEKRREEDNTPLNPPLRFPPQLDTSECRRAWEEWLSHKRRIKRPYKTRESQEKQLKRFAHLGPERFVAAIEHSIAQEYVGIHEEQRSPQNGRAHRPRAKPDHRPRKEGKFDDVEIPSSEAEAQE